MMQHRVFTLCMTIIAGTLAVGRAAVVERDWKNLGDGLLTYDDVNNREWLAILGAHLSTAGGLHKAVLRAADASSL
jgi:hypothetical protein